MPEHSVEVLQRRIAALTRTNTVLKTELKRARAERTGGSSFMRANLDKLHGALKDTQSRVETLTIEKSKIEKVQQTKDEFMASMSHELRTPLATIIGNCDLLLERAGDGDELEIIHAIQRAGHNQLALVNDILDMSKIESGKFTIDEAPFDLNVLLHDLEQMFLVKARDRGIAFTIEQQEHCPFCCWVMPSASDRSSSISSATP